MPTQPPVPPRSWTFLTNHAHALVCIARNRDVRLREIAADVGITERAAHKIVADLVAGGYVTRMRIGSHNRYDIHPELPLRHSLERGHAIGDLLTALEAAHTPSTG